MDYNIDSMFDAIVCYYTANMRILENEPLAPYTSLRVGGRAEKLIIAENYAEVLSVLQEQPEPLWILGYGCNVLVSDSGLSGTTLMCRGGETTVEGTEIIVDAGVWWDDVVLAAIEHNLWGLELLSGIPSGTGGAVFGNIAAYGGQTSDTLSWIEVYNTTTGELSKRDATDITFAYRSSSLQNEPQFVILRAAFSLITSPIHELRYESALTIASEKGLDPSKLEQRREILLETRKRAGSLYEPSDELPERTAGSFFKNPLVSLEQAKQLAAFDESGKTLERLIEQSVIHGGSAQRASAAHVLLAAGFSRGQRWNNVELHHSHVLKVATLPGATASEVFTVTKDIQTTVRKKLGIELEPEVRPIGTFVTP